MFYINVVCIIKLEIFGLHFYVFFLNSTSKERSLGFSD